MAPLVRVTGREPSYGLANVIRSVVWDSGGGQAARSGGTGGNGRLVVDVRSTAWEEQTNETACMGPASR
jgi:hypothetical protein